MKGRVEKDGDRFRLVVQKSPGVTETYFGFVTQDAAEGRAAELGVELPNAQTVDVDGDSRDDATAAALRLADELKIDLLAIPGTGKGGRVTLKDVERFSESSARTPGRTAEQGEPTAI